MKESEIKSRIMHIICDNLRLQPENVDESSDLIVDLGADALDLVSVQLAIEEGFGIFIPEDVADGLNTVSDYINYVRKQVN